MTPALATAAAPVGTDEVNDLPLMLELLVKDVEVVRELEMYPDGPVRQEFALNALKIGVLALRQARGQIDTEVIQRETQRMLTTLDGHLKEHASAVNTKLNHALSEYFDPTNGRFAERVQKLVAKDGDLERTIRGLIGAQDSELCRTLTQHVGQNSPLLKLLSPNESEGLLAALRTTVEEKLAQQSQVVLGEFSLDNQQGALCRLIAELKTKHGELTKELQEKIDDVVKEFSLDEENSALSRLVKNVDRAQKTISQEFSLDNEGSAFSRLGTILEDAKTAIHSNLTLDDDKSSLARLKKELVTIFSAHVESNNEFQNEIRTTLATMVAKRQEAERSTRHGLVFEAAVGEFVQRHGQQKGDVFHNTANETGRIKHCKKGDCTLQLSADSAAAGARIVIEAKEVQGFTLRDALEEMKQARENRDAQMGVFVFSKKCAPAGLEPFTRYGEDAVVVWDAEDATTDVYFTAALLTARYLCIRSHQHNAEQTADFNAIDKAILEIQKQANSLEQIQKSSETIKSANTKILDHIERSREAFGKQIEILQAKVSALKSSLSAVDG